MAHRTSISQGNTNYRNPTITSNREFTINHHAEERGGGEGGLLPALKGNNYRILPGVAPGVNCRFRSSGQGESKNTSGRSNQVNNVNTSHRVSGEFANSGQRRQSGPAPLTAHESPTSAGHNRAHGNFPALTSTGDSKCPPLVSPSSQRGGQGSGRSRFSSTSTGHGKEHSPDLPAANLSNLTAYEREEIKEYTPKVYYAGIECKHKIQGTSKDGFDDENGHYRVVEGDHIVYRYEIVKELGRGTFGVVVKALDHKRKRHVAVKIIKGKPSYTKQAKEEVKILQLLARNDPHNNAHIVRLLDVGMFRNHYILVFELLGMDLYTLCQKLQFKPLPMTFIYQFCTQMLASLEYSRSNNIIHCDVKPENVVVSSTLDTIGKVTPTNPLTLLNLKVIDFGSACFQDRRLYSYIQSRYYRAPEIVLGIPYTHAIDMWSFGCVLCELANGFPIFPASCEGELLERMVEYLGPIPSDVLSKGKRTSKFYDGNEMRHNLSKKGRQRKKPFSRSLQHFLKSAEESSDQLFFHLVSRCLEYNPSKRIVPREALDHPWMQKMRSSSKR